MHQITLAKYVKNEIINIFTNVIWVSAGAKRSLWNQLFVGKGYLCGYRVGVLFSIGLPLSKILRAGGMPPDPLTLIQNAPFAIKISKKPPHAKLSTSLQFFFAHEAWSWADR